MILTNEDMDRETIKDAARWSAIHCTVNDEQFDEHVFAFMEGAEWRINSVWHEANKEIPIALRPILVEHDDGKFSVNMAAGNMQSCPMAWSRWAYVDDLLPDRKEDER